MTDLVVDIFTLALIVAVFIGGYCLGRTGKECR